MRVVAAALSVILSVPIVAAPNQARRASPIFTFESDEFWLNLHHFLCALGLREGKSPTPRPRRFSLPDRTWTADCRGSPPTNSGPERKS